MLRFALAYGFRNIQTVLRKIKMGLSQYDYIEVMACPSGCINGGGQMPPGKGSLLQSHVQDVDNAYHHPQVCICLQCMEARPGMQSSLVVQSAVK